MKGFRRYDDLEQHLEGHHKITTEDKLPRKAVTDATASSQLQGQEPPFPFPFLAPGYARVGANGYRRRMDLDDHWMEKHPFIGTQNHDQTHDVCMPSTIGTQDYGMMGQGTWDGQSY